MITCGGRSSESGFQGAAAPTSGTLDPHGGARRATPLSVWHYGHTLLGVQGRFSGGVWLVRQSADFAEEPLEGPDLVAERPPPLGSDLYPGAWALRDEI